MTMTANEALDQYIGELRRQNPLEARKKIKEIRVACDISRDVYQNWRRGRTPIRKLQRREITRILGVDLFNNVTD